MIKKVLIPLALICIYLVACNNATDNIDEVSSASQEKLLRDSVAQFPDSLLLKEKLIQYFRSNGNIGQAITETEKFIQKDTASARLWDIKATLYFEKNDTASAIKAFEQAVTIDVQPEYLMSLGSLYAQTKNPMALTMADELLKVPNGRADKQALFIKGLYYSYTGDNVKAISFFDNCLSLDYMDVMAYREKAICLYNMENYKEAIKSLDRAVALQSGYDEAYYWLGRCYEKINQPKEAIMNYQTALQIDPNYTEAKAGLKRLEVK